MRQRRVHVDGIPIDDRIGEQVQASCLVRLLGELLAADLAFPGEEEESPEHVNRLALVELNCDPPAILLVLEVSKDEDGLAQASILLEGSRQLVLTLTGLQLADEHPEIQTTLEELRGVTAVEKRDGEASYTITLERDQTQTNDILRAVMEAGAEIKGFREDLRHLNEAFMDLTEPGVPPPPPRRASKYKTPNSE